MKICNVCATQCEDDVRFCPQCGSAVEAAPAEAPAEVSGEPVEAAPVQPVPQPEAVAWEEAPRKSKKGLIIAIIVILLVAAAALATWLLWPKGASESDKDGDGEAAAQVQEEPKGVSAADLAGNWEIKLNFKTLIDKANQMNEFNVTEMGGLEGAEIDPEMAQRAKQILTEMVGDLELKVTVEFTQDGTMRAKLHEDDVEDLVNELFDMVEYIFENDIIYEIMDMTGMPREYIDQTLQEEYGMTYDQLKTYVLNDEMQQYISFVVTQLRVSAEEEGFYEDDWFVTPTAKFACEDGKFYFENEDGEIDRENYFSVVIENGSTLKITGIQAKDMDEELNDLDAEAINAMLECFTITKVQ